MTTVEPVFYDNPYCRQHLLPDTTKLLELGDGIALFQVETMGSLTKVMQTIAPAVQSSVAATACTAPSSQAQPKRTSTEFPTGDDDGIINKTIAQIIDVVYKPKKSAANPDPDRPVKIPAVQHKLSSPAVSPPVSPPRSQNEAGIPSALPEQTLEEPLPRSPAPTAAVSKAKEIPEPSSPPPSPAAAPVKTMAEPETAQPEAQPDNDSDAVQGLDLESDSEEEEQPIPVPAKPTASLPNFLAVLTSAKSVSKPAIESPTKKRAHLAEVMAAEKTVQKHDAEKKNKAPAKPSPAPKIVPAKTSKVQQKKKAESSESSNDEEEDEEEEGEVEDDDEPEEEDEDEDDDEEEEEEDEEEDDDEEDDESSQDLQPPPKRQKPLQATSTGRTVKPVVRLEQQFANAFAKANAIDEAKQLKKMAATGTQTKKKPVLLTPTAQSKPLSRFQSTQPSAEPPSKKQKSVRSATPGLKPYDPRAGPEIDPIRLIRSLDNPREHNPQLYDLFAAAWRDCIAYTVQQHFPTSGEPPSNMAGKLALETAILEACKQTVYPKTPPSNALLKQMLHHHRLLWAYNQMEVRQGSEKYQLVFTKPLGNQRLFTTPKRILPLQASALNTLMYARCAVRPWEWICKCVNEVVAQTLAARDHIKTADALKPYLAYTEKRCDAAFVDWLNFLIVSRYDIV